MSGNTCQISIITEFPDPPGDVQVEAGPQHGTLLVTWSPPVNTCGLVTGYCVYANGSKVKELISPTSMRLFYICIYCINVLVKCEGYLKL